MMNYIFSLSPSFPFFDVGVLNMFIGYNEEAILREVLKRRMEMFNAFRKSLVHSIGENLVHRIYTG